MSSNRKKQTTAAEDEVEQLLKAAEDEVFLKLNVNSHMSRVAPSYLQSDLDHRFQSLKKPNKSTPNPNSTNQNSTISQSDQVSVVDDDELFARFATLKSTLPSSSVNPNRSDDRGVLMDQADGDDVDEVEKIIQWAVDAARLDPSPPTDDEADTDEDEDDDHDDDEDDDDDSDADVKTDKKSNRKKRK